jgi:hypothetical protein
MYFEVPSSLHFQTEDADLTSLIESFGLDHRVYAHQLNVLNDTVLLVQLSEAELSEHSFLDERIFRPDMKFEWAPWDQFEAQAASLPGEPPSYIFHIGHCGSTLLSRLVAAATSTQALREPLPLRTFAIDRADGTAGMLGDEALRKRVRLFERVWAPATVKATSICTNVIDLVHADAPVVFLYQQAETHLAVILAGDNALQDLRGFGQNRYRRLVEFAPDLPPLASLSVGELAATTWLAEVSSGNKGMTGREVLKLDFDAFLQRPDECLTNVCKALDLNATAKSCTAAVAGPIMRTYSKAPEHAYGPKLRGEVIADSQRRNAAEISKGMQLIDRFRSTTCDADYY